MLVQCVGGGTCAKGGESAQGGRVALKRDMSICKEHHHAVAIEQFETDLEDAIARAARRAGHTSGSAP